MNLCLPRLSGLYLNPNRSFFWISAIGLSMPCNLFPNPFPAWAPLSSTCFMLEWVISESFDTGAFNLSPTYIALTNSKDLNEHFIAFSFVSTYGALDEVASNHIFLGSYTDELSFCHELDFLVQGGWYNPNYVDPWPS